MAIENFLNKNKCKASARAHAYSLEETVVSIIFVIVAEIYTTLNTNA